MELSGFIYNQRVAAWEPLIEPLEDPVHSSYRNWRLVAKVSTTKWFCIELACSSLILSVYSRSWLSKVAMCMNF